MNMHDATPAASACRAGCGACCIAPSLSSPIPGMPDGKPAGVRCVQLTGDNRCRLYGSGSRPAVCVSYRAGGEYCGRDRDEALGLLAELEILTSEAPDIRHRPGRTTGGESEGAATAEAPGPPHP